MEHNISTASANKDALTRTSTRNSTRQSVDKQAIQDKEIGAISSSAADKEIEKQSQHEDEAQEPDLIDWEGEDDPEKPMNWTNARKAKNIIVICYCTFLTPLGSTMFAPAIEDVMRAFHASNPLLASFVVSVWVLGYFFGPLFLGPLSELYGRLPVYITCNILFTIFNVATALAPSLDSLVVFRFLAGTFGGCPITIGAGSFGDLIRPRSRGKIIAIWSLGPIMGPILGPIAGGYLGQGAGWRWICWTLAIASGVGAVATVLFQEESYPPTLLDRKLKKLRKETGNPNLRTAMTVNHKASYIFARGIIRPCRLLFLSPIVSILSVYQGVSYGLMYLLFTTFPLVFKEQYSFSAGSIGLSYLGMGIGSILGLGFAGWASDATFRKKAVNGRMKPEYRLVPLIPLCFTIPIGLFWYGWSTHSRTHWIVPEIGTVFIGVGMNIVLMCCATYFIDAYPLYEASATAASTAVRSLIGCLVPLFGRSMYDALGLGWGNSLIGFIALAMCPLPWLFWTYGERIRTNPRFQLKL